MIWYINRKEELFFLIKFYLFFFILLKGILVISLLCLFYSFFIFRGFKLTKCISCLFWFDRCDSSLNLSPERRQNPQSQMRSPIKGKCFQTASNLWKKNIKSKLSESSQRERNANAFYGKSEIEILVENNQISSGKCCILLIEFDRALLK